MDRQPTESIQGGFAVVLNCIDGRAQQPLLHWVRTQYDVDYGRGDRARARRPPGAGPAGRKAVLDKVCMSRLAHLSCYLVVAGHHDCATNPVPRPVHEEHIRTAVHRLRIALPCFDVAGIYLDERWTPCPVVDGSN